MAKRIAVTTLLLGICLLGIQNVFANVLLFHEDFNTGVFQTGVPTIALGADKDWYGARLDTPSANATTIANDIAMNTANGSDGRFGRFEDEAGILFNISTVGYQYATLDFTWSTYGSEGYDRLRVGWLDTGLSTSDFDSTSRTANLTSSATASWQYWHELMAGIPTSTWTNASYVLPGGKSNL